MHNANAFRLRIIFQLLDFYVESSDRLRVWRPRQRVDGSKEEHSALPERSLLHWPQGCWAVTAKSFAMGTASGWFDLICGNCELRPAKRFNIPRSGPVHTSFSDIRNEPDAKGITLSGNVRERRCEEVDYLWRNEWNALRWVLVVMQAWFLSNTRTFNYFSVYIIPSLLFPIVTYRRRVDSVVAVDDVGQPAAGGNFTIGRCSGY